MNRCINVTIGTTLSNPDVPQGSVLGPALFITFTNAIVFAVPNVNVLQYVDELRMFLKAGGHCPYSLVQFRFSQAHLAAAGGSFFFGSHRGNGHAGFQN